MERKTNRLRVVVMTLLALGAVVAFFLVLPTPEATADKEDQGRALPEESFAITKVKVFDGTAVIGEATVIVRDGRVESVTPGDGIPSGVPTVDGTGRTLLPGLIDAHTHTWGAALADSARFGVTTSLDMFTAPAFAQEARKSRELFERKAEADLYSAGVLVTVKGGHGTEYGLPIPTLDDASDADAFVRQRVEEGSDYVKIVLEGGDAWGMSSPSLDDATLAAAVRAAHAHERLAIVHVSTLADGKRALSAGADGLVHTFGDVDADEEFLSLARERGAFVISTLAILRSMDRGESPHPVLDDEEVAPRLSTQQSGSLRQTFPFAGRSVSHAAVAMRNVRRFHERGIPVLAGSDAPNPGTAHGVTLHEEMAMLVEAGLTPVDALRAATSVSAKRFGLEGRGCIATGCRADLVLVDGDPTSAIGDSLRIAGVWKNGFVVEREIERAARETLGTDELVSDFEGGEVESRFGAGWMETSDRMMNGTSTASLSIVAPGAGDSRGALRVEGEIGRGFPFPWAGAIVFPGAEPMSVVDASSRTELVFWVRSNTKEVRVMAFSESLGTRPAEVSVPSSDGWTEVRVPLERFEGFDRAGLRAFAICAGPEPGAYRIDIDDVRLR